MTRCASAVTAVAAMSCACHKIGKTKSKTMNTKTLAAGAMSAAASGVGIYAEKFLAKQNYLGLDPMLQDAAHIALGIVIPSFVKGKSAGYAQTLGASIAGSALVRLVDSYLPADFKVSGTDNAQYALAGYDNANYALAGVAGSFPERTAASGPYQMAG